MAVDRTITYQVTCNGRQLIAPSQISMTVGDGERWGVGSKLKGAKTATVFKDGAPGGGVALEI